MPHERSWDELGERASDAIVSLCARSEYEMACDVSEKTCTSLSMPPMNSDWPSSAHLTCGQSVRQREVPKQSPSTVTVQPERKGRRVPDAPQ